MDGRGKVIAAGTLVAIVVLLTIPWWSSRHGQGESTVRRVETGAQGEAPEFELPTPGDRATPSVLAVEVETAQREPATVPEPVVGATAPMTETAAPEATRVEVFVVDHGGRGIPGVTVKVAIPGRWGTFKDLRTSVTARDGRAVFTGYPRGSVWAEVDPETLPPGHIPAARTHGTLAESPETTLTLECPAEGALRGTVARADGSSIGGAHVRVRPIDHASNTLTLRTDETGAFQAEHVHPGTWSVSIDVRDGRAFAGLAVPTGRRIHVAPGRTAFADLVCRDDGEWILGRVIDQHDRGVARILVRAQEPPVDGEGSGPPRARRELAFALTGPDGSFRLGPLDEGTFSVQVGQRHGSSGVTRDGALFELWPEPYLAETGSGKEHVTVVRVIDDTIEWRIRPRLQPDFAELLGLTLADVSAEVGFCRLFEDSTGAWTFVTQRSGEDLVLNVEAGEQKWRLRLPEPDGHTVDTILELPPPRSLR